MGVGPMAADTVIQMQSNSIFM